MAATLGGAEPVMLPVSITGNGLGPEAAAKRPTNIGGLLPAGYFKPAFLSSSSIATKMNGVASGCPCDSHFTPLT